MTDLHSKILQENEVLAIQPDFRALKFLSRARAEELETLIFGQEGRRLKILTTNNFPEKLKKFLGMLQAKGYDLEVNYCDVAAWKQAMTWYDRMEEIEAQQRREEETADRAAGQDAIGLLKKLLGAAEKTDPEDFVKELVKLSFQTGASDLHLQSEADAVLVRLRIDGVLQDLGGISHEKYALLLQKIKFLAGVKVNIDAVPQDGRFRFDARIGEDAVPVDARISVIPGIKHESLVLRFLSSQKKFQNFAELGISGKNYEILEKNLRENSGIVIVAGPTGSGKTTTLYAALQAINDGRKKIITLEDPVEYQISGIQQSQINPSKKYDFAMGMKAVLRHDPDVILIGETRDLATAELMVTASLTGHAVFTSLHVTNAIEVVNRLLSMGVKTYLLAPALRLVTAQRLVRKLDENFSWREANFAEKKEIEDGIQKIFEISGKKIAWDGKVPEPVPRAENNHTGFRGRTALIECLEITEDLKKIIVAGGASVELLAKARENGFLTMAEIGIEKVLAGETTLEELRRVL